MASEVTTQSRLVDTQRAKQLRSNQAVSASISGLKETPRQELPGEVEKSQEARSGSNQNIGKAVDDLNSLVQSIRRELQFTVEDNSGKTIIKVINSENKEIIRQIPAEEVVSLAEHFADSAGGLLNAKV